jgi:hypothetical protein
LGEECIWFLGELRYAGLYFSLVVTSTLWLSKTDVWPISKNKLMRNHYKKFTKFTNKISVDKLNEALN